MFSMRRVACVECIDAILIGLSWGQEGSLLCLTFPANSSNCSLDWIWSSQAHSITQQSLRFFGPSNNVASRQGISFSRISIQIKSSTSPLITIREQEFGNLQGGVRGIWPDFAGEQTEPRWYPILGYFRYDYDLINYEYYECHLLHHGILWYFMAAWFGSDASYSHGVTRCISHLVRKDWVDWDLIRCFGTFCKNRASV